MEPFHCHRLSFRCWQFPHCQWLRPTGALAAASVLERRSVWQQGRLPCPASAFASVAAAQEAGPNPRSMMLPDGRAVPAPASWGRMSRGSAVGAPHRSFPAAQAPVPTLQTGTAIPSPARTERLSEAGCTTERTTRMPLPPQGSAGARQESKQDAGCAAARRWSCHPRSSSSPSPVGAASIASGMRTCHVDLHAMVRRQVLLIFAPPALRNYADRSFSAIFGAKYVSTPSAPARLNAVRLSTMAFSPSIQPFCAAATIIA